MQPYNRFTRLMILLILLFQLAAAGCQGNLKQEIAKLNDPQPDVRRSGADELGRIQKKEAVLPLIKSLEDEDPEVILSSISALNKIKDDRAILPLILLLSHKDPAVRYLVKITLAHFGSKAVRPLLLSFQSQTTDKQVAIVEVLSAIGKTDADVVSGLARAVTGPFPDRVRMAAAGALGRMGDDRGIQPLVLAIKDEKSPVRYVAFEALLQIGSPAVKDLIDLVDNEDLEVVRLSINALGKSGDRRAVMPLVNKMGSKRLTIRNAAKKALIRIGQPAVKPLINLFKSTETDIKKASTDALVQIGEPAVRPLIKELKTNPENFRPIASDALIRIGSPAVVPLIVEMKDVASNIRALSSKMLTTIGKPSVDPLIQAMNEKDPEMMWRYAVILGNIGHERAVGPLLDAIDDNNNSQLQYSVAKALAQIGSPSVTPLIKEIIKVTSEIESTPSKELLGPVVKYRLVFKRFLSNVLLKIGEPAVLPLIDTIKQKDVVGNAVGVDLLERIGSPAVEALINALGEDDPDVQFRISEVLIKIGTPSVEPLIAVLEVKGKTDFFETNPDKFWRAVMILGKIKDHRAVGVLISTLLSEASFVRLLAVEALGAIGDKTAIEALVGELSDWPVRYRAVKALEILGWQPASTSDRIRYLIGKGEKTQVMLQSAIARKTLLEDLYSNQVRRINYAVHAFLNLWGLETISDLIIELNQNGNPAMAVSFANTGYDRLEKAAEVWVEKHGYDLPQVRSW